MKKVISLFFCITMLVVSFAQASIQSVILGDIIEESPDVWGVAASESGEGLRFVPDGGGIKVCKAEKKIIVGFYLSDDDIEFYSQTFSDDNRKPIGFEIEIVDYSSVFNNDNIIGYNESFNQNVRYDDNPMLDDDNVYSVSINDPTQLAANTWHTVEINFSDYDDVALATFAVQVQLVGDIRKLSEDYSDIYDEYSSTVKAELLAWWTVLGGSENVDGNNFFNIREPRIQFWRDKFFGWPEGSDTGYDRVFWRMGENGEKADYKPYSCSFGSDPWDSDSDDSGGDDSRDLGDSSSNDDSSYDPQPHSDTDNDGDQLEDTSADNISIREVRVSLADESEYSDELTLYPGELYDAKGYVKNKGDSGVDVDFRFFYDDDKTFNFNKNTHHYLGSEKDVYIGDGKTVSARQNACQAPDTPGRYYVYLKAKIATDGEGDTDYSDRDIREQFSILTVIPRPVEASFSAVSTGSFAPAEVSFTDSSTGPVQERVWDFGDGVISTEVNPTHTYSSPGAYTVTLFVDNFGFESSASLSVLMFEVPVPPPYVFSFAQTAGDVIDLGGGEYEAVNPTDSFALDDPIHILAKLEDSTVQIRWKCDIYHDGDYWWTFDTEWRSPSAFDYFTFVQDGHTLGIFTFEVFVDDGDGYDHHATLIATVGDDPDPPPNNEDYCHETAETATNGGWGWNPVTEEGCLVEEESEGDPENYCHETDETATNGGWGWNPVTEEGCLVEP